MTITTPPLMAAFLLSELSDCTFTFAFSSIYPSAFAKVIISFLEMSPHVNRELPGFGKQAVTDQFGSEIPMYDIERTIVELVCNHSKFEIQDFNTALKTYVGMPDKNLAGLSEYAKAFRVDKILRGYLEILL